MRYLSRKSFRPLVLTRYPDGIDGKSFYQKDWDQKKPDFVSTAKIHSEHRGDSINYIICNNKETLLWVANLGCIEMHPWYSRINDFRSCNSSTKLYEEKCGLNFPDFILFDLDPYIYSGKEKRGEEPQYNVAGFKAAVDIAHGLKDIFKEFGGADTNTGSTEAQIAMFSERINYITGHLKSNKKDFSSTRALVSLVGKRRKLLNYLAKKDVQAYRNLLERLKLRR